MSDVNDKYAIIGIGCRLPGGANDHRAFWDNLSRGKDCLTGTPADRYDILTLGSRDKAKPGRLVGGRGGYIDGFDEFEPAFFGISPREADSMDPQQRKMLEVTWEALEDAGLRPDELAGKDVGVYVGAFTLDYKIVQFADLGFETLAAHTATGTMMTMVSNRISYCFDFRGPSMSIDTACSSSHVAVHLACQSLRRGECSLAVAGGVLLHMTPQYTIAETKGGFLSPEGRSRAFDAGANGYVRAEGAASVIIKRLADALRDGDPIHAVIIGSGVNQDGRTSGITVPSGDAQIELIRRVCEEAGIQPGDLQYVEAHGTSTPVGDPIEANALGVVLADGRAPGERCFVGSVKTNIGHTESAAGVAGLIKTTLSLKHAKIPPHINLERVNPAIDLATLPIQIPTTLVDWPEHRGPARAGVNSFGFGGTNAHVLLEEAPASPSPESVARPGLNVLPLSARDPAAFPEMVAALAAELRGDRGPAPALADVGYTLARRRQHLDSRLCFVHDSPADLQARFAEFLAGEASPRVLAGSRKSGHPRRLAWVFSGMGPQWFAMGRQLFEREPVYRAVLERCDREIHKLAGWSLIDELGADADHTHMAQTWLAQPANFAVQAGLAALWRSLGVHPQAVVGHSTGEVAAFYEAGVYSFEDAIKVTIHRSRLQQLLVGTGTMLAAGLSEQDALARIRRYTDTVAIGAINGPTSVTLAGDAATLEQLAREFADDQIFVKFLKVPIPYHSPVMDRIKDDLLTSLADIDPRPAKIPLYLTAIDGLARGPELDAAYWWRNVRDTVRFQAAVERMSKDGYSLFLEVGPHPVLGNAIVECLAARSAEGQVFSSIRRGEDEQPQIMASLAALHNVGVEVAWDALYPAGRVVSLPRYPWRRDRHWIEPAAVRAIRLGQRDHELLGRRLANAEPTWEVKLDAEDLPYLADHRIQGNVVFPAAGYIEMAAQAVRKLTGATTVQLADIEVRKALFVPASAPKAVQLTLDAGSSTFRIASVPEENAAEVAIHALGAVRLNQPCRRVPALAVADIMGRAQVKLDGPACYAALAELGYEYGPAFQGIEAIWIAADEALARIRPPQPLGRTAAGYHLHPSLLDACFQTLLAPEIRAHEAGAASRGIRLPLSIAEVRSEPVGDQPLWVHARITSRTDDALVGDIAMHADSGQQLGTVTGFRAANIEKVTAKVGLSTLARSLFEVAWIERGGLSLPERSPGAADRWIVFADAAGRGAALAARARARGDRACVVRPGLGFSIDAARTEATVAADSPADIDALFAALGGAGERRLVVHLWNLDAAAIADASIAGLRDAEQRGAYSLVVLARALLSSTLPGQLHVVTRGAQSVEAGAAVEPLGAPAWGVGRVLWSQELTEQRGKLIDLDPTAGDLATEADLLLREILTRDDEEIAIRGDRRYTSRLRSPADLHHHALPVSLRPDGCYLVTGAFGALGRLLCRFLIKRGARRLILMGRSKLPPRGEWRRQTPGSTSEGQIELVKELEALGAEVIAAPVDITDEAAFVAWLAEFRTRCYPPIRGVFHSAGQVRDALIGQMEPAVFQAVYDPKVVGSYLLHRHLADEPLDHFVLFSSVASLLTTAGQTNYAAGNAFLDALAHHRRALGLPALSVNWGPWATGMIEQLGLIDHYRDRRGMSCLAPETGIDVLDRVLGQDLAQILVVTIENWPVFLSWYAVAPPLVADIAQRGAEEGAQQGGGSFLDVLRETAPEARLALVSERFRAITAQVLRARSSEIAMDATLNGLGLDSLLAIELRNRIASDLGASLPVVTLLSGATIDKLVATLHHSLSELCAHDDAASADAVVERFTDETQFPLTQNQKAIWFLKQLNPDGFAYNIGGAVAVAADLDPDLMLQAVRLMIQRHPMLRANFVLVDGRPVQRIAPEARVDVKFMDVQGQSWDCVYQTIIQEYRKPYDLEHDPLMRFRLMKRGEGQFILMKGVHHMISDAISTFTFIEELLVVYDASRRGQAPTLPPIRAHYLDFLNWQNKFLASPAAQRMFEYWKGHLPAEVPLLNLPTDRPRPLVQTNNGASCFFKLDRELTAKIHAQARDTGATLFMLLLGAYYVLLSRYSSQDEIIIGSPVMGRTQESLAATYGYFVNPLPLHVSLKDDPTFLQLLAQVKQAVLNGLDNQEYPFALLVEKLGLAHDPSRSAVFQAMFILLVHRVATEKYGFGLQYIELPEEEGQFDLTLSAYEDDAEGRLHCVFKYNSDLFVPETVERMASHYVALLAAMVADPGRRISEYEMLTAAERARILDDWSGAGRGVSPGLPVHAMIADRANASPDAIAVVLPGDLAEPTRTLSYGQLEARSNRLARHLTRLGAGDDAVVAVCLEKSPELVVSLLAALKTGGVYLPIDQEYPDDRAQYMIRNADARFIVTDAAGAGRFAGLPGCTLVVLDGSVAALGDIDDIGDIDKIDDIDAEPFLRSLDLDRPAYVIYTSGSTGRPKGVRVTHRNIAAMYHAWEAEYRLRAGAQVHLQMASFAFDVFTGDLVRALCSGGQLVLVRKELLLNTARLYEVMVHHKVGIGEFVPAVARSLITYCERESKRLEFMQLLIVGSDVWKVEEYARLRALLGRDARLVNSYGLTEATIDSTYFEGSTLGYEAGRMVPIGAPFPGCRIYILDARGAPVPTGVPGELWVGGEGVAAGYVNDPAQTDARFVTVDLDGRGPARLYRSGDMARWDAQGGVHLLGRADNQVKVRGHRIETGEIEAQLLALPGVTSAAVVGRGDADGEVQLCAYFVGSQAEPLDVRAAREHLASRLPTFMVPSHILQVPAFPLTANGKVDVAALPMPGRAAEQEGGHPPRTLYEVRVAEHWRRLLGVESPGVDHDFFALGGSSLKLIELIYHLQTEFNIAISVGQLFKSSSLLGMARAVEDVIVGRVTGAQLYLRFNAGHDGILHCFPPAGGHGLVYRKLSLQMPEREFVAYNYLAQEDKVRRYADLVESIQSEGPYVLLGYSLGGNLAFEVAKELEQRGRTVANVVIMDSYRITQSLELTDGHLAEFERELREHLRQHTGSDVVERVTLEHARDYTHFCNRTANHGVISALVSVISDEDKAHTYELGRYGSWHGSSSMRTDVHRGHGKHADMLGDTYVAKNAAIARDILAASTRPQAENG